VFLKQLEMTGFKSFAQTVRIELGPGLTAIVGPNGSGKSNIVDAVRWVLGEQSARAIRGTKSEDVIFAGSAMRRPLGMAEVTLVLDNTDRRVAIDLAEISAARRLYRSGETEYLLNRRRTRLRDVLDVAGQAGLGPDSYCVVGQGAIDQLALQRPQERRALIADAADIRRFEARLAEIESDLLQTQQNALRISAVTAEVRPQLDRLRVQADRAQRHRDVRDEVEQLAVAWYGRALPEGRERLAEAERRGRALSARAEELRATLGEIDRRRAALHGEAAAARQRMAAASVALQDHRARREKERLERAAVAERLQSVETRSSALRLELADAEAEHAAAKAALERSSASLKDSQTATPVAADDHDVREARAYLDEARSLASRVQAAAQRSQAALVAIEREDFQLRARLEGLAASAGQRAEAEERQAALIAAIGEADARRQALELDLAAVEERIARARIDAARDAAKRESAGAALREARRALDGLLGEERAIAGLNTAPRGSSARLLSAVVDVPLRYRRAIAAALGTAAQYQVVAAKDTAWFVDDGQRGPDVEPVLVPDSATNEPADGDDFRAWVARIIGDAQPYELAIDLVTARGANAFVRRYLGTTIVVASLAEARSVAQRLREAVSAGAPRVPFHVASADGHCLGADGEHRVGLRAADDRAVELEERKSALAIRIADARRQVAALEEEFRATSEAGAATREAMGTEEAERVRIVARVKEIEGGLTSLRGQLDAESKRLARLDPSGASAEIEGRIAANAKRAAATRAELEGILADLRDREAAVGRAEEGLRAAMDRHATASVERALAEERLARMVDAVQRDSREVDRLAARIQTLQSELTRLDREGEVLRLRLDGLNDSIAAWDAKVAAEEANLAAESQAAAANVEAAEATAREFESVQTELADARAEQASAGADAEHARGIVARLEAEASGVAEALGVDAVAVLQGTSRRPDLGALDSDTLERRLLRAQRELRSIGSVDYGVLAEYAVVRDRYQFLTEQLEDLNRAEAAIREGMAEARQQMRDRFARAFDETNLRFKEMFRELFRGGDAELLLIGDPESTQCGIDIAAQPPGKRQHRMATLSGGERSLVGAALLLALISVNPSPFCMLDEVDAALDETNVQRFVSSIRDMSQSTQFILVTHNRATMEMADALYGVTMTPGAISQVVSIRLEAAIP